VFAVVAKCYGEKMSRHRALRGRRTIGDRDAPEASTGSILRF